MKHSFVYAILAVGLMMSCSLNAQKIKLQSSSDLKLPSNKELTDEKRLELIKTVETTLNEYAVSATMLDPAKKKVTGESVKQFQTLFTPTAEVVKDYSEIIPDDLVNYKDYASGIFNLMSQQGLQVKIIKATLVEIENDASGYYVPVVKVQKQIYNYVNTRGEVKTSTSGRLLEQEIRFDVSKENLTKARIAKIKRVCKGKECDPKADYITYSGVLLGGAFGIMNAQYTDTWETQHKNSALDVNSDLGLSLGYEFLSNRLAKRDAVGKNLFFGVGAQFNYHIIKVGLSDFAINTFNAQTQNATVTGDYERSGDNISVDEQVNVGLLEIPLGVGFRLKNTASSAWMVNVRLIPGFVIMSNATGSGKGDYYAALEECNWFSGRPNAYNPSDPDFEMFDIGTGRAIDESPTVNKSGMTMGLLISPTGYFDLNEGDVTRTLSVGLDFRFNLNSFFAFDESSTDQLEYATGDYEQTLINQYYSSLSSFSIGLRVGMHRKKVSNP